MSFQDLLIILLLGFIVWNLKAGFERVIQELQRIGDLLEKQKDF